MPFPQQHPRLARAWLASRGVGEVEVEARGVGEVEAVGAAALAAVSVEGSNPQPTELAARAAAGLCRCRSWWHQVL